MKTHGDKIVVGYRRFRKIKTVEGYKKLEEIVARHLSVITKAYCQDDGGYIVVVRYQLWPIFAFIVLLWLIFIALQQPFKANTKVPMDYVNPEIPTIKEVETGEYQGKLMSVPGYVRKEISGDYLELEVRNPGINDCIIVYELFYDDRLIGSSGEVYPGNTGKISIKEGLPIGNYDMKLMAKGISMDKKTIYNSVSQKVEIIIC